MSIDMEKVCRTCLSEKAQTYDLYTSYYSKKNILYYQMLYKCTEIKPFKEDLLPRIICKECIRQLKKAYAFNVQCLESQGKLLSILEEKTFAHDVLKVEDKKVKEENGLTHLVLNDHCKTEDLIKTEAHFDNDDCWDADDDNLILGDIRTSKLEDESRVEDLKQQLDFKTKKKRGRKSKAQADGTQNVPEKPLLHQCDVCGKFLSTKSNLKAHKISHTEHRPYKCTDCPATFRGYSALYQHRKIHTGETPYHCDFCPKKFSRRTGLVNHVAIHTGEKSYVCELCLKDFAQSAQLSIHMKRHKGDKSYLCQTCGKGFPVKADLHVHQRVHNGEKPYSCHLCTKTFATSGNLSIHVRIHNKEVRYHCSECQRGFVTCSAYKVHLKRHRGQRDYVCDCGKTFYTSSGLKQHKVVHTGEKRYQCKVCLRKFSQTSHLSRHFKREHVKPNVVAPTSDHYKVVLPSSDSKSVSLVKNDDKCEISKA